MRVEVRSELFLFDKDGKIVEDKNIAEYAVIRELDENDDLVNETFLIKKENSSDD